MGVNRPGQSTSHSGTWRLGRVLGVDLLVRPSLLAMVAVLVVLFSSRFNTGSRVSPYILATLFVVGLYVSVLLHEIAHVVVAKSYRMRVPSITLHLLGGETAIQGDSRTPAQEFWTSIVGPLASLAVALAAWLSAGVAQGTTSQILGAFAYVNGVVGLMNLLPALPLDGGHVFKAGVWAATGNKSTGTKAAAWAGRLLAILVLAAPFLWSSAYGSSRLTFDLVVALLIALFLWTGASQALRMNSQDERLDRLRARDLVLFVDDVRGHLPTLSADLFGADLIRAMAAEPSDTYRLIEDDGSTLGILAARSVEDAYRKGPQ